MFEIRPAHFAALRRRSVGDALTRTLHAAGERTVIDPATGAILSTDALGNVQCFGFNADGFLSSAMSPMGRSWSLDHDTAGRVRGVVTPTGVDLRLSRNQRGEVEEIWRDHRLLATQRHDPADGSLEITHPDGTSARFDYRDPARLAVVTDRTGHREEFLWSDAGVLTGVRNSYGSTWAFEYAASASGDPSRPPVTWSRPTCVTFPDGTSIRTTFDEKGYVARLAEGDNASAEVTRDDGGRPLEIRYSDGEVLTYAYDDAGHLVAASTPTHRVTMVRDVAGRVLVERAPDGEVRHRYDALGRLRGVVYPSGPEVTYDYDADSRVCAITDWQGGRSEVRYLDSGYEVRSPNHTLERHRDTGTGHPFEIAVWREAGGVLADYRYALDDEDRIERVCDHHGSRTRYEYDAEHRLLKVTEGGSVIEEFSYDHAGNRHLASGSTAYDTANQLRQHGPNSCTYDDRGQLKTLQTPQGDWRFVHSARGMLVRVDRPDGTSVHFEYDALGRRIRKIHQATVVSYRWGGDVLLEEHRSGDGVTVHREYAWYPATMTPFAHREGGEVFRHHVDHRGAPVSTTDSQGVVRWEAAYAAFGWAEARTGAADGPADPRVRLAGQFNDPETGLHYNRFRYYSPIFGRYLTRDPLGLAAGRNAYLYAHNSPIQNADPLGLWPTWGTVAAVAAGLVVGVAAVLLLPAVLGVGAVGVVATVLISGALAGAVAGGLDEGLNRGWCWPCIARRAMQGALVGAVASVPFLLLPAGAGVLAVGAAGGASGAVGYTGSWLLNPGQPWNWKDFGVATATGAALGAGSAVAMKATAGRAPPQSRATAGAGNAAVAPKEVPVAAPPAAPARIPLPVPAGGRPIEAIGSVVKGGRVSTADLGAYIPKGTPEVFVPNSTKFPNGGFKYRVRDSQGGEVEVWGHGPDMTATDRTWDAAQMPTVRVKNAAGELLGRDGIFHPNSGGQAFRKLTHIPLEP